MATRGRYSTRNPYGKQNKKWLPWYKYKKTLPNRPVIKESDYYDQKTKHLQP